MIRLVVGLLVTMILSSCVSWEEEAQFRVKPARAGASTASVDQAMQRMQYRFAESLPATHSRVRDKRRYTRSRYPHVTVFWLADGNLFFQLWDAGEGPFQSKSPYFHEAEKLLLKTLSESYGSGHVERLEYEGVPR